VHENGVQIVLKDGKAYSMGFDEYNCSPLGYSNEQFTEIRLIED
jgi:hypothetical protein